MDTPSPAMMLVPWPVVDALRDVFAPVPYCVPV